MLARLLRQFQESAILSLSQKKKKKTWRLLELVRCAGSQQKNINTPRIAHLIRQFKPQLPTRILQAAFKQNAPYSSSHTQSGTHHPHKIFTKVALRSPQSTYKLPSSSSSLCPSLLHFLFISFHCRRRFFFNCSFSNRPISVTGWEGNLAFGATARMSDQNPI